MTLRSVVPALVTVVLTGATLAGQEQFTLLASFTDQSTGKPVETMAPGDLGITEDGAAATVVKVEPVTRTVRIEVLIDNGAGVGRNIVELRTGVRGLIEALPPDVETTLVTTSPQPRFLVKATKSRDELLKGVDRLAPDTNTGRFTESLAEAGDRAVKDKDGFHVIIAAGTTSGDGRVSETDIQRAMDNVARKAMLVHVLLYAGERSTTGGTTQVDVGEHVAQATGGRYEFVNAITRYSSLMPEIGADIAKQFTGNARQFRVTVQRPAGKKGTLGKVSVTSNSKTLSGLWRE